MNRNNKAGFSFVELMVSVVIFFIVISTIIGIGVTIILVTEKANIELHKILVN
jgi:hypothetical protein